MEAYEIFSKSDIQALKKIVISSLALSILAGIYIRSEKIKERIDAEHITSIRKTRQSPYSTIYMYCFY